MYIEKRSPPITEKRPSYLNLPQFASVFDYSAELIDTTPILWPSYNYGANTASDNSHEEREGNVPPI